MVTGILGGAFDPIHLGHIEVARAALERLGLDRVLVMPSGSPPYKRCRASREDRCAMVEAACAQDAGLVPCDVEVRRPGDTYAAETLAALAAAQPGDRFVYIIGADVLSTLPQWRDIEAVAGRVRFAAVGRPGWDRRAAVEAAAALGERGLSVEVTDIEGPAISSGMVRDAVARGEDPAALVGPGVAAYIRARGLYLCDCTEPELLERLRRMLTLHRYHHTLGVAETAERLAARFGVDPARARLAGLLHDCAKSMPYGEMRALVAANVADTDEQELDSEPVLHAPAGMVVAKRDFGVQDPAILQAIRRHTLGGSNMTPMDALIYVSDFIEPGRRPFPGLQEVRELAEKDIFAAMRACARLTNQYVTSRGQTSHPRTLMLLKA